MFNNYVEYESMENEDNNEDAFSSQKKLLPTHFNILNAYILIFILSNVYIWEDITSLYWAKHIITIAAAFLYFFIGVLAGRCVSQKNMPLYLFWMLGFALYLFVAFNAVGAFQYLVFFGFICCVSSSLKVYRASGALILAIILLPVIIDLILNEARFIYNTYYGRPRLLLGIQHPKETGNIISSLLLLYLFFGIKRTTASYVMIVFFVFFLLYFVQSRNSLLFVALFFSLNVAIKYFGLTVSLVFYFVTFWFVPVLISGFYYDQVNSISSFRLDNWSSVLESYSGFWGALGRGDIELRYDMVRVDNYFVSLFVEAGVMGIFWIVSLFVACCCYLGSSRVNGWYVLPLVPALFTQASLDAGLFSTGNILNVVCWAIIIYGIQQNYFERSQQLRGMERVDGTY